MDTWNEFSNGEFSVFGYFSISVLNHHATTSVSYFLHSRNNRELLFIWWLYKLRYDESADFIWFLSTTSMDCTTQSVEQMDISMINSTTPAARSSEKNQVQLQHVTFGMREVLGSKARIFQSQTTQNFRSTINASMHCDSHVWKSQPEIWSNFACRSYLNKYLSIKKTVSRLTDISNLNWGDFFVLGNVFYFNRKKTE